MPLCLPKLTSIFQAPLLRELLDELEGVEQTYEYFFSYNKQRVVKDSLTSCAVTLSAAFKHSLIKFIKTSTPNVAGIVFDPLLGPFFSHIEFCVSLGDSCLC